VVIEENLIFHSKHFHLPIFVISYEITAGT